MLLLLLQLSSGRGRRVGCGSGGVARVSKAAAAKAQVRERRGKQPHVIIAQRDSAAVGAPAATASVLLPCLQLLLQRQLHRRGLRLQKMRLGRLSRLWGRWCLSRLRMRRRRLALVQGLLQLQLQL